jgi:hypothetical protein
MENSVEMALSSVGMKARVRVLPADISVHEDADYAAILNCYDEEDVTSTIALKLVSQNSPTLSSPKPGDPGSPVETLNVTPYSVSQINAHGAKERTIRIDIVNAQQNSISRQVFMARENHTYTRERFRVPSTQERKQGDWDTIKRPEYIRLRFKPACFPESQWKILGAYPEASWDQSRLTFKTDTIDGGLNGAVSAIAFQRPDAIVSKVVLSFGYDLSCRVEVVERDDITSEVLRDHCLSFLGFRQTRVAKSVLLYHSTGVYDGARFTVKPEYGNFMGRNLRILHLAYLPLSTNTSDFHSLTREDDSIWKDDPVWKLEEAHSPSSQGSIC